MNFEDILQDRTHGSTYLAKKYLEMVHKQQLTKSTIIQYNQQFRQKFDDMAIVANITKQLDQSDNPSEKATMLLNNLEETVSQISKEVSTKLSEGDKILTFSNSQTIIDVVKYLELNHVFCMESQPGGEGEDMAEALNGKVISDSNGYQNIADYDSILVGCDRYDSEVFVNKVGTKKLVELAADHNKPVYVLTSQFKEVDEISSVEDELFEIISRENVSLITD